jgi:hypothetical protein
MDELEPRVIGEPRRSAFRSFAVAQEGRNLRVIGAGVEHPDDGGGNLPHVEPGAIPPCRKQLLHTGTPESVFVHGHCRFRHEVGKAKGSSSRSNGVTMGVATVT